MASSASGDDAPRSSISARAEARGGKVRVDDRDLVAVAHARQRVQQVGGEQRMDAFQHDRRLVRSRQPPLTPPCVSPTTISFWMTIVSSSTGSVTMIAAAASGPQASCSKVSTL